jgi:hypothetical protein
MSLVAAFIFATPAPTITVTSIYIFEFFGLIYEKKVASPRETPQLSNYFFKATGYESVCIICF